MLPPQVTMSTGKRLAKRSIIGTRVVVPGEDGRFYPGLIQAMKTEEDQEDGKAVQGGKRYSVRLEGTRKVNEFSESEIIGPGFRTVSASKLRPGQIVYITHCNREVQGSVICHRPQADQVIVRLLNGGPEVKKKLEEVRLLESRKSARLLSHGNTDFSKLADFNIVHERKRINSETSDISGTSGRKRRGSESALSDSSSDDYYYSMMWGASFEGDRCSSPLVMSECTAAMVLMNLSCSPTAVKLRAQAAAASSANMNGGGLFEHQQSDSTSERLTASVSPNSIVDVGANVLVDGSVSPSSSGVSSLGSSWSTTSQGAEGGSDLSEEAEALLQLSHQESDEGIVSDQSSSADPDDATKRIKTEHVRIVYQCTWPGCGAQKDSCSQIETHVRRKHLGRKEPISEADQDGEEEFYYTEIEVPLLPNSKKNFGRPVSYHLPLPQNIVSIHPVTLAQVSTTSTSLITTSSVSYLLSRDKEPEQNVAMEGSQVLLPNLADHMDMARPPHENPEYLLQSPNFRSSLPEPFHHNYGQVQTVQGAVPIAIPVTNFTFSTANPATHVLSSPPKGPFLQQAGGGKFMRLSPKPAFTTTSPTKSPHRKPRGDAKKCRKVYGMDHRDQWCTQCKWKKACTRFGEAS